MDSPASAVENKVQKCIVNSWQQISLELKKYCDIVNLGQKHISLIIAHNTTLSGVSSADIQDTELYKIDPDISLKLQYSIRTEILSDETAFKIVLYVFF